MDVFWGKKKQNTIFLRGATPVNAEIFPSTSTPKKKSTGAAFFI